MKTSKKWAIHIACYVIAALALSILNELHPAVKYRTEVIEPQTEALQPTAVIDLDNDNPYAYAGQESDGKLYLYADKQLAVMNPRVSENRNLTFMQIVTTADGAMELHVKGFINVDAQGHYSLDDAGNVGKPMVIKQVKDGEPIMQNIANIDTKRYKIRLLRNTPLGINADAVAEAAQRVSPDYTPAPQPDPQQEKMQEYIHNKSLLVYKSTVFYSLLGITVLAVIMAILLFAERDEIELGPKNKITTCDDELTISTEYQKMPKLLLVSNYLLLALIAVITVCLCVPQLTETIFANLFAGFFEGLGAIIMLTALACAMAYNCWMMSRHIKDAEACDTDKGFWLTAVEILMVIVVNTVVVAMWLPVSLIPVFGINVILALPNIIIAYATSAHRSELHWMLPVHEIYKWISGFTVLAFVVLLWIFNCLLQGKVRSDELEAAANAKRQLAEGNDFYATGEDGKLHHFQRVGSSDEWRDLSDEGGQIYYRNGTVLTRAAY